MKYARLTTARRKSLGFRETASNTNAQKQRKGSFIVIGELKRNTSEKIDLVCSDLSFVNKDSVIGPLILNNSTSSIRFTTTGSPTSNDVVRRKSFGINELSMSNDSARRKSLVVKHDTTILRPLSTDSARRKSFVKKEQQPISNDSLSLKTIDKKETTGTPISNAIQHDAGSNESEEKILQSPGPSQYDLSMRYGSNKSPVIDKGNKIC